MKNIKLIFADPRRRTIIITILAAFVLLVLSVILVVNLVSKPSNSAQVAQENSTGTVDIPFGDTAAEKDISAAAENNLSPVDNSDATSTSNDANSDTTTNPDATNSGAAAAVSETFEAPANSALPKTGPADNLALILILGTATAYFVSRRLATTAA